MKTITLADFLTDAEIKRAQAIYASQRKIGKVAQQICDKIIRPNMDRINQALGQENDAMYLAYAVEYVLGKFHSSTIENN